MILPGSRVRLSKLALDWQTSNPALFRGLTSKSILVVSKVEGNQVYLDNAECEVLHTDWLVVCTDE